MHGVNLHCHGRGHSVGSFINVVGMASPLRASPCFLVLSPCFLWSLALRVQVTVHSFTGSNMEIQYVHREGSGRWKWRLGEMF